MKKILLVCLLLFMCSCELTGEDIEIGALFAYDFNNDIKVESLEDAVVYVAYDIKYKSDWDTWGVVDYWQTPEQTKTLKTGDCEDKAILLMYLLKNKLNHNPFLLISLDKRNGNCHATVFSNDLFIDATKKMKIEKQIDERWIIVDIISYAETIRRSINHYKYH